LLRPDTKSPRSNLLFRFISYSSRPSRPLPFRVPHALHAKNTFFYFPLSTLPAFSPSQRFRLPLLANAPPQALHGGKPSSASDSLRLPLDRGSPSVCFNRFFPISLFPLPHSSRSFLRKHLLIFPVNLQPKVFFVPFCRSLESFSPVGQVRTGSPSQLPPPPDEVSLRFPFQDKYLPEMSSFFPLPSSAFVIVVFFTHRRPFPFLLTILRCSVFFTFSCCFGPRHFLRAFPLRAKRLSLRPFFF